MIIEFPHGFRRTPLLDELEAELVEQEIHLETELEEVRQARESLRATLAANGPEKAVFKRCWTR